MPGSRRWPPASLRKPANAPTFRTGNGLVPAVVAPTPSTQAYTWLSVIVVAGVAVGSPIGVLLIDSHGGRAALWAAAAAGLLAMMGAALGRPVLAACERPGRGLDRGRPLTRLVGCVSAAYLSAHEPAAPPGVTLAPVEDAAMHELALTQSIVDTVSTRTNGAQVRIVHLEVGKLSGVVPDAVRFCFELVADGTTLSGATLDISEPAGEAHCRTCELIFPADDFILLCPCGSADVELLHGDQLLIRSVEVL